MNPIEHTILFYKKRLGLEDAEFSLIAHDDATVATVFKITQSDGLELILKIHAQPRHYTRELYFLHFFAQQLPVPKIVKTIPPMSNAMVVCSLAKKM